LEQTHFLVKECSGKTPKANPTPNHDAVTAINIIGKKHGNEEGNKV